MIKKILLGLLVFASVAVAQEESYSLWWDGNDDYILVSTYNVYGSLTRDSGVTVEAWVYLSTHNTDVTGYPMVLDVSGTGGIGMAFGLPACGGYFTLYTPAYNQAWAKVCTKIMPCKVWTHILGKVDHSTITYYMDGKLINTLEVPVPANALNNNCIGKTIIGQFAGVKSFNGSIRELRVWNYARSHQQIQNTWDLFIDYKEAGLIMNYHLLAGDGYPKDSATGNRAVTSSGVIKVNMHPPLRYEND